MQIQPKVEHISGGMPVQDLKIRASVRPGSTAGTYAGIVSVDGVAVFQTPDLKTPEHASSEAIDGFTRRLAAVLAH